MQSNINDSVSDRTKVDDIAIRQIKGGKRHLPVSSETLLPEKNAEPEFEQQQTSEDGTLSLNLVTVSDVGAESTPARDAGLQDGLAKEPEAANIEFTQVPSTDAVDFCSSPNPSKPKAKSTRKRKASKESSVTGGKATFSRAKGKASTKEDPAGDTSGKEGACAEAGGKEGAGEDASENEREASI
jgi:hypothetical protein